MTVTYTAQVATSSFGCFLKLLLRWRGSIYKLVWKEFIIFVTLFYILNFVYRFALKGEQKTRFEMVTRYCEQYNNLIPVAFVLGFYVSIVVSRWWEQFNIIPWPDRMALFVTANIRGHDERARLMRRTLMRYLCLSYVITMSSISPVVKKRFPTFKHMVDAGFLNSNEENVITDIKTQHNKYFVPLAWATSLVSRARKENKIQDDFAVKTLIDEINAYRGQLGALFNFDWISIPLVYTQVVTLAVYSFFLSCLMGRQLIEDTDTVDIYVPVFTFLQFLFYMGWLKVAESLVNPFGEDDDDFDINNCIDRNLQVSYLVVDEIHQELPELIKDQYWDETQFQLPYTNASLAFREEPHLGSAMHMTPKDTEFIHFGSTLNAVQEENENGVNIPRRVKVRRSRNSPVFGRSVSRNERSKFLNRILRHSVSKANSEDSRRSGVLPHRQTSETSTITEVHMQAGEYPRFEGVIDDHVKSQEDMFEMSDLDSIMTERPSNLDLFSSQMTLPPEDNLDGATASVKTQANKSARDIQAAGKRSETEQLPENNSTNSKGKHISASSSKTRDKKNFETRPLLNETVSSRTSDTIKASSPEKL